MLLAYALVGLMALTAAGWITLFWVNVSKIRKTPTLRPGDASHFPSDATLVSILVPARNEASRVLIESIVSMARQDYPNLEIVVVDDRSTDGTLDILRRIERAEPRVRVVRGADLPAGWLGKPWALEQAKREAKGQWILATDADIIFEPQAVRSALSVAFRGRFDAISLAPSISGGSFWTRIILPVAAWMIAVVFPIDKTNDPESPVALGCGAFLLMRREAHDAVGGYEAIRAEVADDVATARAIKSSGRRFRLESGLELLHTPMYDSFGELWHGFSKNAFAGADNRISVVARNSLANVLATILPTILMIGGYALWFGAHTPGSLAVAIAATAAYVAMVVAFVPVYGAFGESALHAPLSGLANFAMVLVLLNSAYRHISGRGVEWKGQRVNLPPGGTPPGNELRRSA